MLDITIAGYGIWQIGATWELLNMKIVNFITILDYVTFLDYMPVNMRIVGYDFCGVYDNCLLNDNC